MEPANKTEEIPKLPCGHPNVGECLWKTANPHLFTPLIGEVAKSIIATLSLRLGASAAMSFQVPDVGLVILQCKTCAKIVSIQLITPKKPNIVLPGASPVN